MTDTELVCSDCGRGKWADHSLRCEPCVMKLERRLRAEIAALRAELFQAKHSVNVSFPVGPSPAEQALIEAVRQCLEQIPVEGDYTDTRLMHKLLRPAVAALREEVDGFQEAAKLRADVERLIEEREWALENDSKTLRAEVERVTETNQTLMHIISERGAMRPEEISVVEAAKFAADRWAAGERRKMPRAMRKLIEAVAALEEKP